MFKKIFFKFLDVSGILIGIFLAILGWLIVGGNEVSLSTGWALLMIGVGAFLIHVGHYFDLRYMRWIFGPDYFITKKRK